jgi:mannose-6-phosphate isomerase-like protein (cupin superfamily)
VLVTSLRKCPKFVAGDNCILRELLHPSRTGGKYRYSLAHATVPAGKTTFPHRLKTTEVYYILSGKGLMHVGTATKKVKEGDTVYIPPKTAQKIKNTGKKPLLFLCIVDPAWRKQDEEVGAHLDVPLLEA